MVRQIARKQKQHHRNNTLGREKMGIKTQNHTPTIMSEEEILQIANSICDRAIDVANSEFYNQQGTSGSEVRRFLGLYIPELISSDISDNRRGHVEEQVLHELDSVLWNAANPVLLENLDGWRDQEDFSYSHPLNAKVYEILNEEFRELSTLVLYECVRVNTQEFSPAARLVLDQSFARIAAYEELGVGMEDSPRSTRSWSARIEREEVESPSIHSPRSI
jgi:hypothetical protein